MKMADMKIPKKTKADMTKAAEPTIDNRDRWPYGLQLRFESEQIAKLPALKKFTVGDPISIQGIGEITSVRMSERSGGKEDYTVEVQLQQVGCESTKKGEPESMMDAMRNVKAGRKT